MKYELKTSQQLAWEPNPMKNPDGKYPVKEGTNLPNSVTEDVGGFSLCPSYSAKQLRAIYRLGCKEARYVSGNTKPKPKFGGRLQWR